MSPNHAKPLLPVQSPVPDDIDIAQSIDPQPILDIAAKLGLGADEVNLYGSYKAKVRQFRQSTSRKHASMWGGVVRCNARW